MIYVIFYLQNSLGVSPDTVYLSSNTKYEVRSFLTTVLFTDTQLSIGERSLIVFNNYDISRLFVLLFFLGFRLLILLDFELDHFLCFLMPPDIGVACFLIYNAFA